MNPGGGGALYPEPPDFDGEPRYDRLDDSRCKTWKFNNPAFFFSKIENSKISVFRLLDAAETLVTLQTSDLGASNNPLFGSNNQVNNQHFVTFLITHLPWLMT